MRTSSAKSMPGESVCSSHLVRTAIEEAVSERKEIEHGVARIIALALHTGEQSAMYSLGRIGAIEEEQLTGEISHELEAGCLDGEERDAARMLGLYVLKHGDRPEVEGWDDLWE